MFIANKERYESLKKLTPLEAVQAYLDGNFGIGDEPALNSAIRKDPRIALSDRQITDLICEAMDEELDAEACWQRLIAWR